MKIALLYQTELASNSLLSKLAKTFSKFGFETVVIGVSRTNSCGHRKSQAVCRYILSDNPLTIYYEINLTMRYGMGIKSWKEVLQYQYLALRILAKERKNLDVVYAIDLLMALPAALFSLFTGKRLIYHVADKFTKAYRVPKIMKPFFELMDFLVMLKAEHILITHEKRLSDVPKMFRTKCAVIYNSPEDINPQYLDRSPSKTDMLRIAFFGVLTEDRFIKELCQIVREKSFLELHIGGYGPLESYVQNQATECNRIKFYGKVPYNKVLEIQSQVDLMLAIYNPAIPNNRQSAPNKLYEAMMLGKPIVVAKGMGIDELVVREKIGFTIEYSVESFEKLVEELRGNRQLMLENGKRARVLYESKYAWSQMEIRLKSLLCKRQQGT